MDNRTECVNLWKQFKQGILTQKQLEIKLSELGLNAYTPPSMKRAIDTFGGEIVNRGYKDEPF